MATKPQPFTERILAELNRLFPDKSSELLERSPLLQYLEIKTRSANRGSKSRSDFNALYAIYVLVEAYVKQGYGAKPGTYEKSEGSRYTDLLTRLHEMPFGSKMQNHYLNDRVNGEFAKFFPRVPFQPILRDRQTTKYWFNENLLLVTVEQTQCNLAECVISIIDLYIAAKRDAFDDFLDQCRKIQQLAEEEKDRPDARFFVESLLKPNVDARIFEIVSFAVLKAHYGESSVFWGYTRDALNEEYLTLFKTGRTNANDGGIDFVLKPVGRFFQVTETLDVKKYFLDIDKVQRFPITFVVKSDNTPEQLKHGIAAQARRVYKIEVIVKRFLDCIEEIINIPNLLSYLDNVIRAGGLNSVLEEIILQSRLEFNYEIEDNEEEPDPSDIDLADVATARSS